jgi:hypothetical protein
MFRFDLLRRFRQFLPVILAALIVGAVLSYVKFRDIALSGALVFASVFIGALPWPAPRSGGKPGVFVARCLSLVGLLLAGVMALNYILNPLGIYPTSYFEPLALERHTIYVYKADLYDDMNPPPEVVVLGSSRSFTVPPAYITQITGMPAFNASIPAGLLRDFLQFTRHTVDEGHPPRVIIIGLSTELITRRGNKQPKEITAPSGKKADKKADKKKKKAHTPGLAERLLGTSTYEDAEEFRADLSYNIDLARQLVSWYQTEQSIRMLEEELKGRPNANYRFDKDGLIHFHERLPLDQAVQSYIANRFWGKLFSTVNELGPGSIDTLETLLNLCRKNNIQVIIYLPPWHPQMLAVYEQQDFERLKAEYLDLLASLQDKYDFTVYDMTTVESFGGDETMFVDGVHPSEEAARLMLDIMLKDVPQE